MYFALAPQFEESTTSVVCSFFCCSRRSCAAVHLHPSQFHVVSCSILSRQAVRLFQRGLTPHRCSYVAAALQLFQLAARFHVFMSLLHSSLDCLCWTRSHETWTNVSYLANIYGKGGQCDQVPGFTSTDQTYHSYTASPSHGMVEFQTANAVSGVVEPTLTVRGLELSVPISGKASCQGRTTATPWCHLPEGGYHEPTLEQRTVRRSSAV